ncbi:hypothetical protein [Nitrosomonas communis]|uniref:hypothetical protein n=1 Tax=Nitrosomonas communis TaxID=44574 RepID=UPI003D2A96E9
MKRILDPRMGFSEAWFAAIYYESRLCVDSVTFTVHDISLFGNLHRWFFGNLHVDGLTLDLDSTIMTPYGNSKARCEHNLHKHTRYSHHPFMAFIANTCIVANVCLGLDNGHSINNAFSFLDGSLDKLDGSQVVLLPTDSGFSDSAFFDNLDWRDIHSLITLHLNQPLIASNEAL